MVDEIFADEQIGSQTAVLGNTVRTIVNLHRPYIQGIQPGFFRIALGCIIHCVKYRPAILPVTELARSWQFSLPNEPRKKSRRLWKTRNSNRTRCCGSAWLAAAAAGSNTALGFDQKYDDKGDSKYECHGVTVVVDKKSALYLDGTTVDFYEGLEKRGFTFENPNAAKSCGCGSSFQA